MKYTLFIPGKPFGKQRHRSTKKGRMYTPKQTVDYENVLAMKYIQKYGNTEIESPAFKVDVYCCFLPPEPPKSASKKTIAEYKENAVKMLNGEILYTNKPDKDNMEKIIGDGLNKIAWYDDCRIVMGQTLKCYRHYQGVLLIITPISSMEYRLLKWIDRKVELEEIWEK